MSESGFEYETAIKDGMSGPAREEIQSLKSLQGEIRATEKSIRSLQQEQLNYKRAGFKGAAGDVAMDIAKLRLPLANMKAELRELKAEEKEGFFAGLKDSLIPEIALGELAAEGIKKVAEISLEGVKFAVEMSEFRENAEMAYEAVLGTKDEAEFTFKTFEALGRNAHLPVERAQGLAQTLLLQGEKNMGTLQDTVKVISELERVGLARGATQFQSIVERSLTTGAFTLPRRVSGLGIQLPDLYQTLANKLHISVEAVKKEIKQGKVDAELGIAALAEAITGGKVGELAARRSTFGDLFTDIKNDIKTTFEGSDVDFSRLSSSVYGIRDLFESVTGSTADMKTNTTSLMGEIMDLGSQGIDAIVDFGLEVEIAFLKVELEAQRLKVGLGDVLDVAKALSGYSTFITPQAEGAKELRATPEQQEARQAGAPQFWSTVIGDIKSGDLVENLKLTILHPFTSQQDIIKMVGEATGKAHVDGLVKSLQDGKSQVEGAASELVGAIDEAGRAKAEAHSPSRVSMRLGNDIVEGLVVALEGGRARTDDAMGMAIPALDSLSVPDFSGMKLGGGGGVVVQPGAIHVEVHAPGGTTATREELQELTEQAMDDALERLVIELGG